MKKLVFNSEDFFNEISELQIALTAQAKFDEWYRENIESAPLVYGRHPAPQEYIGNWANRETDCDTHTARLIDIQEIKKECANHEPMSFEAYTIDGKYICRHCSVELILEWRAKP